MLICFKLLFTVKMCISLSAVSPLYYIMITYHNIPPLWGYYVNFNAFFSILSIQFLIYFNSIN